MSTWNKDQHEEMYKGDYIDPSLIEMFSWCGMTYTISTIVK